MTHASHFIQHSVLQICCRLFRWLLNLTERRYPCRSRDLPGVCSERDLQTLLRAKYCVGFHGFRGGCTSHHRIRGYLTSILVCFDSFFHYLFLRIYSRCELKRLFISPPGKCQTFDKFYETFQAQFGWKHLHVRVGDENNVQVWKAIWTQSQKLGS